VYPPLGSRAITVLQGKERSSIKVPFRQIIDANGKVKIDSNINRGLIEIRQSGQGDIVLKIGGVVGRLPINSNMAIDISPKFPMGNLARLMSLSDDYLSKRMDIWRSYEVTKSDGYLPELLLKNLAEYLKRAHIEGTHREYVKQSVEGSLRPRINFTKSSQRFWAKGQMTKAVSDQFQFTRNNLVNQILSEACKTSISLSRDIPGLHSETKTFVQFLAGMPKFKQISHAALIDRHQEAISTVPSFKPSLAKAIEISIEILKRSGVSYLVGKQGIELPSYLINLETAFESYCRNILSKGLRAADSKIIVGDGNRKPWIKKLFNGEGANEAKPDLVITYGEDRSPTVIGDVKYKRDIKVEDRYQIIAHALSYNVDTAFLCCPAGHNQEAGLVKTGEIGNEASLISLYEYRFDLQSSLEAEEKAFVSAVFSLLDIDE